MNGLGQYGTSMPHQTRLPRILTQAGLLPALIWEFHPCSLFIIVLLGMDLGYRSSSHLGMARTGSGLGLVASLLGGWEVNMMEGTFRRSICFDGPASILIIPHQIVLIFYSTNLSYTFSLFPHPVCFASVFFVFRTICRIDRKSVV